MEKGIQGSDWIEQGRAKPLHTGLALDMVLDSYQRPIFLATSEMRNPVGPPFHHGVPAHHVGPSIEYLSKENTADLDMQPCRTKKKKRKKKHM